MSESRRTYHELFADIQTVPIALLQEALTVIGTGTSSFGKFEEWDEWFHYLLPFAVSRAQESYAFTSTIEPLVTAYITQYPNGIDPKRYPGFSGDVLRTLGQTIMDPICWPRSAVDIEICLQKFEHKKSGLWNWRNASPKLSASLFFCLKYLPPDAISIWISSVLRIPDAAWRAQLIAWFVGAREIFSGQIKQPSQFKARGNPEIAWEYSHCLRGNYTGDHRDDVEICEFIPAENLRQVKRAVADYLTGSAFLEWLNSMATCPQIEAELGDLPFSFYESYGSP